MMGKREIEARAWEAGRAASAAFPWIREQLPVRAADGSYPITGTFLEEPVVSMLRRAELAGPATNLVFLGPRGLMALALEASGGTGPALSIPADSAYTVGEYLQDVRDLGRPLPVKVADGAASSASAPRSLAVA